ncbi:MAG: hypothetical protein QNJ48_15145 [Desulfobacterales bacterium]|nr:hypothetical protein [Desulfobacterales bacterium]MDJ0876451.1 hypothetical protein [Desulfobacterales bacterium]MDJ0885500.1 hypothetical protein [Desulfobacterales bacterium]
MGSIEIKYDLSKGLTLFKAVGQMKASDFFDCLASYYEKEVTLLTLWDLTEVDLSEITTGEIEDFADYARHLSLARKGGKTALVFSGVFEFGIGRMFEAYLEIGSLPFEINCFRSLEAASEWLGVDVNDARRD